MAQDASLILGIDPGSRITGYALIEDRGQSFHCRTYGTIQDAKKDLPQRLALIHSTLSELIKTHRPDVMAIEEVFVAHNPQSALKLGQARGVALSVGAHWGCEIAEYTARCIKKTIVGYGQADKSQIQHMICTLLHLSPPLQADAADALAVALCHAHHPQTKTGHVRQQWADYLAGDHT